MQTDLKALAALFQCLGEGYSKNAPIPRAVLFAVAADTTLLCVSMQREIKNPDILSILSEAINVLSHAESIRDSTQRDIDNTFTQMHSLGIALNNKA